MKVILSLLFLSFVSEAADLWGKVISVESGDSLTVLDESAKTHPVRLAGIDAPERKQPFFEEARSFLSKPLLNQWVNVSWTHKSPTGQLLAVVTKKKTNFNFEQVAKGYAWFSEKVGKLPEGEASRYQGAQSVASQTALGLWSQANAVPPWEFRKRNLSGPIGKTK